MIRRTSLAALLALLAAAACSQAPTDTGVRADAPAALDSVVVDNPPPPDSTKDTGGGTLGSGT